MTKYSGRQSPVLHRCGTAQVPCGRFDLLTHTPYLPGPSNELVGLLRVESRTGRSTTPQSRHRVVYPCVPAADQNQRGLWQSTSSPSSFSEHYRSLLLIVIIYRCVQHSHPRCWTTACHPPHPSRAPSIHCAPTLPATQLPPRPFFIISESETFQRCVSMPKKCVTVWIQVRATSDVVHKRRPSPGSWRLRST